MENVPQAARVTVHRDANRLVEECALANLAERQRFQEIPNKTGSSIFSQIISTLSLLFPVYSSFWPS